MCDQIRAIERVGVVIGLMVNEHVLVSLLMSVSVIVNGVGVIVNGCWCHCGWTVVSSIDNRCWRRPLALIRFVLKTT